MLTGEVLYFFFSLIIFFFSDHRIFVFQFFLFSVMPVLSIIDTFFKSI